MKRHPSLAHLSRDHHGALILARLLQKNAPAYKGLPAETDGKSHYALKFYKDELVKHFEEEEDILKLVIGVDIKLDQLVESIYFEHQQLHVLFGSMNQREDLATHLDELGKALEAHIRKEERELFPLIEATCSEDIMTAIERALSQHTTRP